jgi:hypothetical protein
MFGSSHANVVSFASIVDIIKMVRLQDFKKTMPHLSVSTYPFMAFISSVLDPGWITITLHSECHSSHCLLIEDYSLKTMLMIISRVGNNWLSLLTTNEMSCLIVLDNYISQPMILEYLNWSLVICGLFLNNTSGSDLNDICALMDYSFCLTNLL